MRWFLVISGVRQSKCTHYFAPSPLVGARMRPHNRWICEQPQKTHLGDAIEHDAAFMQLRPTLPRHDMVRMEINRHRQPDINVQEICGGVQCPPQLPVWPAAPGSTPASSISLFL